MGQTRLLDDAASVLVHLSGPPSLSFAEVGAIMQEIARQASEGSMLHLGVSTLPDKNAPVVVTILAKAGAVTVPAAAPVVRPRRAPSPERPPKPEPAPVEQELPSAPEPTTAEKPEPELEPAPVRPAPPQRPVPPQPSKQSPSPAPKPAASKIKQETLQFEPVARGRFEKIEPTIVEGEDLDVPTFLRLKKP